MISRYGLFPFACSLDTVGVLSRSVEDAAIAVDAMKGIDPKDMTSWDSSDIELYNSLNKDVKGKKFISNPGCYATATELALIPLLKAGVVEEDSIIVDAKSGLTGAGKALSESSHFVNVHDNYVTYKLNRHQHIPEIVQELKLFDEKVSHIQF